MMVSSLLSSQVGSAASLEFLPSKSFSSFRHAQRGHIPIRTTHHPRNRNQLLEARQRPSADMTFSAPHPPLPPSAISWDRHRQLAHPSLKHKLPRRRLLRNPSRTMRRFH